LEKFITFYYFHQKDTKIN